MTYQANVRRTDIRGSRGFYLGSRLQLQLLDGHISHDEFLNFAGYGHEEFRYKFDVSRHLIMGDFTPAELSDFLFGGSFPRLEH